MPYLALAVFLAFPLLSFSESSANPCPCAKIKAERKCGNPDCVEICGLQSLFKEISEQAEEQCLKEGLKDKTFVLNEAKITAFEDFLEESKEKIKEIEEKNQKNMDDSCPDCHLNTELELDFDPLQSEKNCDEEYIKTHKYSHSKKLESETCGQEQETKLHAYFQEYVESIIGGENNSEMAKKLWKDCPDPCSFDINYSLRTDKKNCSGDINLKVKCTHRVEKSWLIPVYNISITYKGVPKCLKE